MRVRNHNIWFSWERRTVGVIINFGDPNRRAFGFVMDARRGFRWVWI